VWVSVSCWNELALPKKLKNLHAKLIRFYSFRDLSVHTDRQTDMARSTLLVILINNIFIYIYILSDESSIPFSSMRNRYKYINVCFPAMHNLYIRFGYSCWSYVIEKYFFILKIYFLKFLQKCGANILWK